MASWLGANEGLQLCLIYLINREPSFAKEPSSAEALPQEPLLSPSKASSSLVYMQINLLLSFHGFLLSSREDLVA